MVNDSSRGFLEMTGDVECLQPVLNRISMDNAIDLIFINYVTRGAADSGPLSKEIEAHAGSGRHGQAEDDRFKPRTDSQFTKTEQAFVYPDV